MNTALQRFRSFCELAAREPVQVDIHLADLEEEARLRGLPRVSINDNPFAQRAVAFACALGALAVAASLTQGPPQPSPPALTGPLLQAPGEGQPAARMPQQRLNYVTVNFAGQQMTTLDAASRIELTRQAADANQLHEVGLSWKDVYGVIHAETNWIARDGMGKNGVPSFGLAQLEPATAQSLQVKDPHDPVQAVDAAARLMKEAAQWSSRRIQGLKLPPNQHAQTLREGVSIYYNLSTAARHRWDGRNAHTLPEETQRHIQAAREGAREAALLEKRLTREQAQPAQHLIHRAADGMPVLSPGSDKSAPAFASERRYHSVAMRFAGGDAALGQGHDHSHAAGEPHKIAHAPQAVTSPGRADVPSAVARFREILQRDIDTAKQKQALHGLQPVVSFLTGNAAQPSPALPAQFSSEEHVLLQQLQGSLKDPCAVVVSPMSVMQYNSACMMNARLASMQSPKTLNQLYPGAMMAGTYQGVPVLVVKDAELFAAAGHYWDNSKPNEHMDVMLITTGTLQRLAGPLQKAAVEFILNHEMGHVQHKHSHDTDPAKTIQFELEADAAAFASLKASGLSRDDAEEVINAVFSQLRAAINRQPAPAADLAMLEPRLDAMEDLFHQWDKELSEKGRMQFQARDTMRIAGSTR